mgnify:CR=1 FL=1
MSELKKIFIGADHAGFALKRILLERLGREYPDFQVTDLGCDSDESVDYPDYAKKVADQVAKNMAQGILVCGSGIGMAIVANKVKGIRSTTVWDVTSARMCREHNDVNVLCLGARLTGVEVAWDAVKVFLNQQFLKGRHTKRIDLIRRMEGE